ncbi:hypothetical protein Moror_6713 [Moniliophthora roreri MCA 2997]|uniref:F-box domain-containing protein n=1 Tax=Moniliophthora roreri (strain MCA 2997) TaxID=1381753 RepID=V2XV23_MONRO|nr:hypothetical protein Moror_6713 [Moniliophthora roreri MCA 2997]
MAIDVKARKRLVPAYPKKSRALRVPFDILVCIFQVLEEDKRTLASCALVNWDANQAATTLLYRSIVFEPPYWYGYRQNDLEEKDSPLLQSACLPRNARHVWHFEVKGYLSLRSSSSKNRSVLSQILSRAVKFFPNLQSVALLPSSYYTEIFKGVLEVLSEHSKLRELSLDGSSINDGNLAALMKIGGLRALTIRDPPPAVVELFSEGWLERSSGSITKLHLEGICTAIPSHVLCAQLANLKHVHTLSLGYTGAQSDLYLFPTLEHMPTLRSLSLQYDEESYGIPETHYQLHLESLTVRYFGPQTRADSDNLCDWILAIISSSPLEELHLIDDNGEAINSDTGGEVKFHRLVQHLTMRHALTLKVLQIPNGYLDADTVRNLYAKCIRLEELAFATSWTVLLSVAPSTYHLHVLSVNLRVVDEVNDLPSLSSSEAAEIMKRMPSLRSLVVNQSKWKGWWIRMNDSDRFVRIAQRIC